MAFCPQQVKPKMPIGAVVERLLAVVLNGLAEKSADLPRPAFVVQPGRVERLADVGSVTQAEKPLLIEGEILAPQPRHQRAATQRRW